MALRHSNVEIPRIFKVRKSGENLDSMNIEKTNERLLAAVNKEPDPSLYNRPNELSQKLSYSSKSTLNSIFRNWTSFRGKKIEAPSEKRIPPNFKVSNEKFVNDKVNTKSENAKLQEEKLREDIPAFLRRQAN